jgi:hypothetical protein
MLRILRSEPHELLQIIIDDKTKYGIEDQGREKEEVEKT